VKVTIKLSLPSYDTLLEHCHTWSREFAILTSGSMVRRPVDGHFARAIEVESELEDANRLLALANRSCPQAAQEILTALDLLHRRLKVG
jgi:hypothetical protein